MNINIVTPVYYPEPVISARTSTDLAEKLCSEGHQVTVITTYPNRPGGKLYDGYERKPWQYDSSFPGYRVLRCFSIISSQSNILSRFLENFSFGVVSALAVLFLEKPDVIYANTWPIFAQGLLALICKSRRIPLVLSIQDLYPESLSVQRRTIDTNSRVYRLLHTLDTWIAKNCISLLVISEQFKEIYVRNRGIAEPKITVVPNWINVSGTVTSADQDLRKKHNIPDSAFLAVYGGNIGMAASVETLIQSYRYLPDNYYLLVAGDGSHLNACQLLSAQVSSRQIKFYSPWPSTQTYPTYNSADLLVLPTLGTQSLVSLPSKILGYMFAGKPIIALASPGSELSRLIELSGCGWVVAPGDPQNLAKQIQYICQMDIAKRTAYGAAGKKYLLNHLTADVCVPKIFCVLEKASQTKS